MKTPRCLLIACTLLLGTQTQAQTNDALDKPCFIGSTAFMLGNLLPEPPSYYQLNVGYRFSAKSVLSLELITWTYPGPLGRQYGLSLIHI